MKCSPIQPATPESGIAFFMLAAESCPTLVSCKLWKEEQAWREMVVPHVEAGHQGPISLALIDEIVCVEVDEDTTSLAAALRRIFKNREGPDLHE